MSTFHRDTVSKHVSFFFFQMQKNVINHPPEDNTRVKSTCWLSTFWDILEVGLRVLMNSTVRLPPFPLLPSPDCLLVSYTPLSSSLPFFFHLLPLSFLSTLSLLSSLLPISSRFFSISVYTASACPLPVPGHGVTLPQQKGIKKANKQGSLLKRGIIRRCVLC